jgi:hypothetical protein
MAFWSGDEVGWFIGWVVGVRKRQADYNRRCSSDFIITIELLYPVTNLSFRKGQNEGLAENSRPTDAWLMFLQTFGNGGLEIGKVRIILGIQAFLFYKLVNYVQIGPLSSQFVIKEWQDEI